MEIVDLFYADCQFYFFKSAREKMYPYKLTEKKIYIYNFEADKVVFNRNVNFDYQYHIKSIFKSRFLKSVRKKRTYFAPWDQATVVYEELGRQDKEGVKYESLITKIASQRSSVNLVFKYHNFFQF